MKARNIIIGALAGVAVGTLIGALYSTSQAEDLRNKAYRKGKGYSKDLKKLFNQFLESLNDRIENASEEGVNLLNKGKAESARMKDKIESALN